MMRQLDRRQKPIVCPTSDLIDAARKNTGGKDRRRYGQAMSLSGARYPQALTTRNVVCTSVSNVIPK
jgi:hypothetical protein